MDLFPRTARAGALTAFFLAVPLGAALAVSFGAALAEVTTWQVAFLAAGAPGLLLALLALVFPDPIRGLSEGVDLERLRLHERVGASPEDYTDLMVNSSYTYSLFGITFSSFALAGLFYWSKAFLTVAKGFTVSLVDSSLGMSFLGAALVGTLAGGLLAGWSSRTRPRAMFVVPGVAMLAAIPIVLVAIYARPAPLIFGGLSLATGRDVHEHRAVLHHHLERDDAQHARRRLWRRPGGRSSSGRHLVADAHGLDGRHLRSERLDGHRVRPRTRRARRASRWPSPASTPRT